MSGEWGQNPAQIRIRPLTTARQTEATILTEDTLSEKLSRKFRLATAEKRAVLDSWFRPLLFLVSRCADLWGDENRSAHINDEQNPVALRRIVSFRFCQPTEIGTELLAQRVLHRSFVFPMVQQIFLRIE